MRKHPAIHRDLVLRAGIGLLLLVVLSLYAPSLPDYFLSDDFSLIKRATTTSLTDGLWPFALGPDDPWRRIGFYRPIGLLLFRWDFDVWQFQPAGYHFTNLALHCLNTALLWAVARRLSGRKNVAFLVASYFALHPAHPETINWISARFDLCSGVLLLLALYLYLRPGVFQRIGWLPYLIALGVKEVALTLPGVLLAWEIFNLAHQRVQLPPERLQWWAGLKRLLPYFGITAVYMAVRFAVFGSPFTQVATGATWTQISNNIVFFGRSLFLLPFASEWYVPGSATTPQIVLAFSLLIGLLVVCVRGGWWVAAWVILPLLPVLTVLGGSSGRYVYLPIAGLAIALGSFGRRLKGRSSRIGVVLLCLYIVAGGYRAYLRNAEWHSVSRLTQQVVEGLQEIRPELSNNNIVSLSGAPNLISNVYSFFGGNGYNALDYYVGLYPDVTTVYGYPRSSLATPLPRLALYRWEDMHWVAQTTLMQRYAARASAAPLARVERLAAADSILLSSQSTSSAGSQVYEMVPSSADDATSCWYPSPDDVLRVKLSRPPSTAQNARVVLKPEDPMIEDYLQGIVEWRRIEFRTIQVTLSSQKVEQDIPVGRYATWLLWGCIRAVELQGGADLFGETANQVWLLR